MKAPICENCNKPCYPSGGVIEGNKTISNEWNCLSCNYEVEDVDGTSFEDNLKALRKFIHKKAMEALDKEIGSSKVFMQDGVLKAELTVNDYGLKKIKE